MTLDFAIDRLTNETASAPSAEDVLVAFARAGFNEEQAIAACKALAEFLVAKDGFKARAHCHLLNAGFTKDARETLIGMMAKSEYAPR